MKAFLAKLGRLSGRDWLLLAEAVAQLGAARAAIATLPFRRIARRLGAIAADVRPGHPLPSDPQARRIGQLIRGAARYLPWECKCLAQAMAGKAMLARRGIPCEVFIGVAAGKERSIAAHAWARSGSVYVTGGRESPAFSVLVRYRDEP